MLELGCGTGRVLLPIARAGIEITGLDISHAMLVLLRQKLAAERPEVQRCVRLVEGDMRDFELGQAHRLVMIPFRTFEQLTTMEDEMACLAAIRRNLPAGGRLLMDLSARSFRSLILAAIRQGFNQAGLAQPASAANETEIHLPDGRTLSCTWRRTGIDLIGQVQQMEMRYTVTLPDGRQERGVHRFSSRWLYKRQAERLLRVCGFEVEHLYTADDKREHGSRRSGDLIIIARRMP